MADAKKIVLGSDADVSVDGFFGPEDQRALDKLRESSEYVATELTDIERQAIESKRLALGALLDQGKVFATYKIELNFGKGRSTMTHFPGSLFVFRSGSALGGGGDELMYPCPDPRCPGFIPPELLSSIAERAGCPTCQRVWPQSALREQVLARLTTRKWANAVTRTFIRLNHDADIYLKSHPVDIRSKVLLEQMGDRGGMELYGARAARVPVIYPLDRILKDLDAGADLEKRFLAFLQA